MKLRLQKANHGIAMVIVMVVILVLGILAGGFAYSMKVEMRLAQQASYDAEFEWLGRSGVELARCVLIEQFKARSSAGNAVDSLNQKWAGGRGDTNVLPDISLEEGMELGNGRIYVKIVDAERKFNINRANPQLMQEILTKGMMQIGADPTEAAVIVDSIQDWIDPDNDPRISGTENSYYEQLDPPYYAKNGPLDDISELLLIKGIQENPAIFWGSSSTNYRPSAFMNRGGGIRDRDLIEYPVGLNDLFTTLSIGRININTAPAQVLQMVVGDTNVASMIIQHRNGIDGQEGTEDDMPFRNVNELSGMLGGGVNTTFINQALGVNSFVFEVNVTCEIGGLKRDYVAVIYRMNQRDANVLYMYWKRPHNATSGDEAGVQHSRS